jgi:hypothetical protein
MKQVNCRKRNMIQYLWMGEYLGMERGTRKSLRREAIAIVEKSPLKTRRFYDAVMCAFVAQRVTTVEGVCSILPLCYFDESKRFYQLGLSKAELVKRFNRLRVFIDDIQNQRKS